MVSFTGRYDASFLQKAVDGSTQTVEPRQNLKLLAHQARDRLRFADSLQRMKSDGRKNFNDHEQALLRDLASDTLRTQANAATRRSGWGRIKHLDGTYEDIAPHKGGIVRTVLDNIVVEVLCEEESDEEMSPSPISEQ